MCVSHQARQTHHRLTLPSGLLRIHTLPLHPPRPRQEDIRENNHRLPDQYLQNPHYPRSDQHRRSAKHLGRTPSRIPRAGRLTMRVHHSRPWRSHSRNTILPSIFIENGQWQRRQHSADMGLRYRDAGTYIEGPYELGASR